jgi:hypothetical protein
MLRLIFLLVFLLSLGSCTNPKDNRFQSLKIKHFAGAAGLTIIYIVTKNKIQVSTNCDFQDCKEQVVYERNFTKAESDSIQNFILTIHLDTLKASYETPNIDDGLYSEIIVEKKSSPPKKSTFSNYSTAATDSLFKYIDKLILTKKYRFHEWGSE